MHHSISNQEIIESRLQVIQKHINATHQELRLLYNEESELLQRLDEIAGVIYAV